VLIGALSLIAFPLVYAVVCSLLPEGSRVLTAVSDLSFLPLEVTVIVLCWLALQRSGERLGRWIWGWVIAWLALNLFGDSAWSFYEVRGLEVPSPGLADAGYLLSYAAFFVAVLTAAWQATGRLRAIETLLDATMFTIGAAGLCWPLIMGPLLEVARPGAEFWMSLAFPIGDLLVLFGFAAFFMGARDSVERPRAYYVILCVAFLIQTVADSGFLMMTSNNETFTPGSWLDPVWLLAFSLAGIAALIEIRSTSAVPSDRDDATEASTHPIAFRAGNSRWRILIPYVGIPIVGGMLYSKLRASGWWWTTEAWVLTYLGLALLALLLIRQYIALAQNRRLNVNLTNTSTQLAEKLGSLADLNERLEGLNGQIHVLNSLRDQTSIAEAGLESACSFAKSPGGWITLRGDDGTQVVTAARGPIALHRPGDSRFNAVEVAKGIITAVPIETRGDNLGTLWLVQPDGFSRAPDLLGVIAAQIGTAVDNARCYQEALHLAERDPLTGLFNHRGIHKRLAGESLRAQQNRTELSLIMIDMDDFKALNDTYGHPVGDCVLRHVSDAIRGVLRHADLAGRVGGDELLIVLPSTGHEGAMQLGERLRERLNGKPYVSESGDSIRVHVSLGVATFPGDAESLPELIEIADANLYASKQQGGDTVTGLERVEKTLIDAPAMLGVAGRLLDAVEARDHYTRKHSERVAVYALSLGESVGLSEDSLNTLHMAAMLHDVGKIGVSSTLLRRPSSLSPAEQDLVRRHVDLGAAVIKDMTRLAQVAEAVNSHHERHDGNGYPYEISGDDIPLLARILAVADAYSAMVTDRPYREALTPEEARAELVKASGTQLDPELVRRFLRLVDARETAPRAARAEAG
jgi:diguanylate cyclase (GGDEF)-like protein